MALAAGALRSIQATQPRPLGRQAALWGVALATLFGSWGVTQDTVRQHLLYRQARQYAEQWFDLVRAGRVHEAHQLHLAQDARKPPGTSLSVLYESDRETRRAFDEMFAMGPSKQLLAMGKTSTAQFLRNESYEFDRSGSSTTEVIGLRFLLAGEVDGQKLSQPIVVTLNRKHVRHSENVSWELRSLEVPR